MFFNPLNKERQMRRNLRTAFVILAGVPVRSLRGWQVLASDVAGLVR